MSLEKQQLISEMIHLAKADDVIHEREYDFILAVAQRMGLNQTIVDALFQNPLEAVVAKTEIERITQFHRLILLMNVDDDTHLVEIDVIRNYGLRMGIRPEAVAQILNDMGNYENKMIPTERLIEIFKRFYN